MLDYFQLYTFNSQLYCCYFSIAYAKNNRMKARVLKGLCHESSSFCLMLPITRPQLLWN